MARTKSRETLISKKKKIKKDLNSNVLEQSSNSGHELLIKCKRYKIMDVGKRKKQNSSSNDSEQSSRGKDTKKTKRKDNYNSNSSEHDSELKYKLPNRSKKWEIKDVEYFNVELAGLDLPECSKDQVPDIYKELILEEWDKNRILYGDLPELSIKGRTVLERLRHIITIGDLYISDSRVRVRCFINVLLNKLGFNNFPYQLYLRYPYSVKINRQSFSTILDFVAFKDDQVFIIIENDGDAYLDFEKQIASEIIMCAHYIAQSKKLFKSIIVNAITFRGTKFVFYKAEFPFEYFSCYESKYKQKIMIKRYPQLEKTPKDPNLGFCEEDGKKYLRLSSSLKIPIIDPCIEKDSRYLYLCNPLDASTLDFFEEKDRLCILKLFYSFLNSV